MTENVENTGKRLENVKITENAILYMQSSRQDIVQFLQDEHQKTGKVPSVRGICKKFGVSSKTLYEIFRGKSELCIMAGLPIDDDSFQKVAKASRALRAKVEKKFLENEELNVLRREEEKIAEEVEQAKTTNEIRKRIRDLYIEKTRTHGVEEIFSSPEKMLDFAFKTLQSSGRTYNGVDIWTSFNNHCRKNNLDTAKTLYETVGPLRNYRDEIGEDGEGVDLDDYILERLEGFLMELEYEETQRTMQKRFEMVLRDFRCECGRDISTAYLVDSELSCPCGRSRALLCLNCKQELRFDPKIDALRCKACGMSFRFAHTVHWAFLD